MKKEQARRGLSYILAIIMVFSVPFLYKDSYNVYAANDYSIDLSILSGDLEIRSSGSSIWVNTGGGIKPTGIPDSGQVVLIGKYTRGAVRVNSATSNQGKVNIKLSGASIENANETFTVTSNTALELELSGDNYIKNAVERSSAILMRGSETDLTITGSGFLSAVMSHAMSVGSAIGGGYGNSRSIEMGDILIAGGAEVYAEVRYGTGIGGGYVNNNGQLSAGSISIENSSVTSISYIAGAGIGSGYANSNAQISSGGISIANSNVSVRLSLGAGIGSGRTSGGGKVSSKDISISNSSVSTTVDGGAGIGGGYVDGNGQLKAGNISITNSNVNVIASKGAGIGGGFVQNYGKLSTGGITLDKGYIKAESQDIDIGEGRHGSGNITVPSIQVIGGSVYAVNNTITPAPTDDQARKVYRVTVPAISSAGGKQVMVGSYKAKTVTNANEHGSGFKTSYPSAGAFIYLPADSYNNISLGGIDSYVAKVVENPSKKLDNTVLKRYSTTGINLDKTSASLKLRQSITAKVTLTPDMLWYSSPSSIEVLGISASPTGIVSAAYSNGKLLITGDAIGSTELTVREPISNVYTTMGVIVTSNSTPAKQHTIKVISTTGGSVSEEGDIGVAKGSDKGFIFTVAPGYRIKDVLVDGVSMGTPSSYTFTNVQSDHTLRVEFERAFPFTDVPESWYREPVEFAYFNDLMNGVSDTLFSPKESASRSMFVSILGRMDGNIDGPALTGFADTYDSAYYATHVKWAKDNEIVKGISYTLFDPDVSLTREQAAAFMVRYAEYKGIDLNSSGATGYSDLNSAGIWAREDILKAQNAGIMEGVGQGRFDPKRELTRAETAQLLLNYILADL